MSVLPKFTYLFRQTPGPLPDRFFKKMDSITTSFVWNGKNPRTLQLRSCWGAWPCFIKYYWAAVLVTVKWWLSEEPANPASTLEAALLGSYSELWNLVLRGPRYNSRVTLPMCSTLQVLDTIAKKLGKPNVWSPDTPLWGNPRLPHFCYIPDPILWALHEITTLGDIVTQGQFITFDALKRDRGLPNQMFFRYLQLRHAFRSQFPSLVTLEMSEVECAPISGWRENTSYPI